MFFVEKSFFVGFFDFWSIFFVDFAISLAAMSLEYSLAKARGNYSLQICLDFQIITILRSRFWGTLTLLGKLRSRFWGTLTLLGNSHAFGEVTLTLLGKYAHAFGEVRSRFWGSTLTLLGKLFL